MTTHPSDTDLERYRLGMIQAGPELDALEEHLLICGECVDRALASDWLATPMLTGFGLHWSTAVLVCGHSVAVRPPNDHPNLALYRRGAVVVRKSVMVFLPRLGFCAEGLPHIRPLFQTRGFAREVVRYGLAPHFGRLV